MSDRALALTDSHSHLDAVEFDPDRSEVLARAAALGVRRHVVPAVAASAWEHQRDVCAAHPGLFPAWGLHPMFMGQHRIEHLALLRRWLERSRPVAVGECGLDGYRDPADIERQLPYFRRQLELAREHDLPVILHARHALDTVTAELRRIGGLRGVVHSFSGSEQQALALWRLGFHLGIGGPVTYPRAERLRRIVAGMPTEYLLIETDSPDQPDAGWRGQRNEPARLPAVLRTIATLRAEDERHLAAITHANAARLFGLDAGAVAA